MRGCAGPGDEADGAPGRETRQTGTPGRETRRTGHRESLPFRPIFAFWVEIYDRQLWESLPFSTDYRLLGRDLHPVALGISTFSAVFRLLGRDLHPAALGISTFLDRFPPFG